VDRVVPKSLPCHTGKAAYSNPPYSIAVGHGGIGECGWAVIGTHRPRAMASTDRLTHTPRLR
jgi:hypothetical protein